MLCDRKHCPERAEFSVYCVKLSGHDTQFIMQCEIQFGHGFTTVAQQCNSAEHWLCSASSRSLDLKKKLWAWPISPFIHRDYKQVNWVVIALSQGVNWDIVMYYLPSQTKLLWKCYILNYFLHRKQMEIVTSVFTSNQLANVSQILMTELDYLLTRRIRW